MNGDDFVGKSQTSSQDILSRSLKEVTFKVIQIGTLNHQNSGHINKAI